MCTNLPLMFPWTLQFLCCRHDDPCLCARAASAALNPESKSKPPTCALVNGEGSSGELHCMLSQGEGGGRVASLARKQHKSDVGDGLVKLFHACDLPRTLTTACSHRLVSCGCHDKAPHTWRLCVTETNCVLVLEARSEIKAWTEGH